MSSRRRERRRSQVQLPVFEAIKAEVFVKYDDRVHRLMIDPDAPILEIKKQLEPMTKIQAKEMSIYYNGLNSEFQDDRNLRYYGCRLGGFFHMRKQEVEEQPNRLWENRHFFFAKDQANSKPTGEAPPVLKGNRRVSMPNLQTSVKAFAKQQQQEEEEEEAAAKKAAEQKARLEEQRRKAAAEEAAAKLAAEEAARRAAEELARLEALEAERLAAEEAARLEAERLAAEEAERARKAAEEEAARLEAERLAAEEAARLEAERLAAEEAERARKAAEEAARLEAERKAAEEAERARKAAEEAARLEAERLAAEKAERARKAAEEAKRARKAAEEAERARKAAEEAEQARKAAEEAEQARKAAEEAERARKAAEEEKEDAPIDIDALTAEAMSEAERVAAEAQARAAKKAAEFKARQEAKKMKEDEESKKRKSRILAKKEANRRRSLLLEKKPDPPNEHDSEQGAIRGRKLEPPEDKGSQERVPTVYVSRNHPTIKHTPTEFDPSNFKLWYRLGPTVAYYIYVPVASTIFDLKCFILESRKGYSYIDGITDPNVFKIFPQGSKGIGEPLPDDVLIPRGTTMDDPFPVRK